MKKGKHLSLDENLLKKIEESAKKQDRSDSWVVNEILKKHYGGKA